ncbi:MAG: antibiotic biosynthesis monooxygenase [Cytophagales bacterium]|nr:antibiotic biosynthesis monooxygenase [Cytophagales bacterium]
MIRVIYKWKVVPENFEAFHNTWSATTNRIHESVKGAQGSFLLRSVENETEVLTIAKWDSLEDWKSFFANQNPESMQDMRKLGERIAVEAYEEIEDHTK